MKFGRNGFFPLMVIVISTHFCIIPARAQNAKCQVRDKDIATIYKGGCKDGLANGKGLAKGRDVFEGTFDEGDKLKGKYTWVDGSVYIGEYKNDVEDGNGTKRYADGSEYSGDFKNGKMAGMGVLKLVNGDTFKGRFENGKVIGHNELIPETCKQTKNDYVGSKCAATAARVISGELSMAAQNACVDKNESEFSNHFNAFCR